MSSGAFAAHLNERGIGAGDRVILALNPGLDYIAALYGLMRLGAIPVPCFPPLRPKDSDRFVAIARNCSPKAIVIDSAYGEQTSAIGDRLELDGLDPDIVYPEHVARTANAVNPVPISPTDIALIQYTSGSTGAPKGVCLTHDNLVSNCQALDRSMGHDPDRVGLSWLPPYHDMGLMGTIILSMYQGWPLVLMSPMHFVQQPRRWLEAITEYGVSITVGPNFSLDLCVDSLTDDEIDGLDLSTVRELYCGAEPVSADTLARFEQRFAAIGFDGRAIIPCYGLAEATLFVSGKSERSAYRTAHGPDEDGVERVVVSCGPIDSEHAARIVDPNDLRTVDDDRVGEIWISGRSVAAGYHNHPELTGKVFRARIAGEDGEYLRTGDLGFIRSGELFVTGRIKDLIIVGGRNIYPQDVEAAAVRADPDVRTAAAFSVWHESSEQLCVVAEARHREVSAALHSKIDEAIRSSVTAEFGVSPRICLCPKGAIPTTTSGKVRRQETKRMLFANGLPTLQPGSQAMQGCTA
jgi:acyl-CoA synthetase (AMP-forming)/AMP-acid ligase II